MAALETQTTPPFNLPLSPPTTTTSSSLLPPSSAPDTTSPPQMKTAKKARKSSPAMTDEDGSSREDLVLKVQCGTNEAAVSLAKLRQGSRTASVLFNGGWISPNQFQNVSGRQKIKDWKRSIRHHGRTLRQLMGQGLLRVDPPSCACGTCCGHPENPACLTSDSKENLSPYKRESCANDSPLKSIDTVPEGGDNIPAKRGVDTAGELHNANTMIADAQLLSSCATLVASKRDIADIDKPDLPVLATSIDERLQGKTSSASMNDDADRCETEFTKQVDSQHVSLSVSTTTPEHATIHHDTKAQSNGSLLSPSANDTANIEDKPASGIESPHSGASNSPLSPVVANKMVSRGSARTSHAGRLSPCVPPSKAIVVSDKTGDGAPTGLTVSIAKSPNVRGFNSAPSTDNFHVKILTNRESDRQKDTGERDGTPTKNDNTSETGDISITKADRIKCDETKKTCPLPRLPSPSIDSNTAIVQPVPKSGQSSRSPDWPSKSPPSSGAFSAPTGVCNPVRGAAPSSSPVRGSEPPQTTYLDSKCPYSDVKATDFLHGAESEESRVAAAAATARMLSLPALLPPTLSPWNYLDMASKYSGFPRESCTPTGLFPPLPFLSGLSGYRVGAGTCCTSSYASHLPCGTALCQRPLCYTCHPFAAAKTFHEYLAALPHATTAPPPVSTCNLFCPSPANIVPPPPPLPLPSAVFNAFHPDILLRKDLHGLTASGTPLSPFLSPEPSLNTGTPAVITPVPRLAVGKRKSESVRDHVSGKSKRKCMRSTEECPLDLSLRN